MEPTFAEKSNKAFKQIAFIIAAVSGAVLFLFFKIYQKIYLYGRVLVHKIETACGCTQMTQLAAMHPWISGALVALGIIILTFLSYSFYKLIKSVIQTRKFITQHLIKSKFRPSSKLRRTVQVLNLDQTKIIEIKEAKAAVFCFGLWKPKICISSGLIKILRQDELEAVLLHEYHHLTSREPLKLFTIKYFQSVFFFLPGIKTCVNKYITLSELAADELATDNFTDRSRLARAILKITENEEKQLLRTSLTLPFFSSVITERVARLADDNYSPKFKLWGRGLAFGLILIAIGSLTSFVFLSDSAKALEMHSNGSCDSAISSPANQSAALACNLNSYQPVCAENNLSHQAGAKCDMR